MVVMGYLIYSYIDGRSDFITAYYSRLSYEQRAVPGLVKNVILNIQQDHTLPKGIPDNVVYYVASQIERRYTKNETRARWRLGTFVTSYLLKRVLNETQIVALNCHFLPPQHATGLAEIQTFFFDKEVIDMTVDCDHPPRPDLNNCYEIEVKLLQNNEGANGSMQGGMNRYFPRIAQAFRALNR